MKNPIEIWIVHPVNNPDLWHEARSNKVEAEKLAQQLTKKGKRIDPPVVYVATKADWIPNPKKRSTKKQSVKKTPQQKLTRVKVVDTDSLRFEVRDSKGGKLLGSAAVRDLAMAVASHLADKHKRPMQLIDKQK